MGRSRAHRFVRSWCIPMGIPVATILKGVDLVFAGLQVADKVITKVSQWHNKRAIMKAIKKKVSKQ